MATQAQPEPGDIPRLREGTDLTKLKLSVEEGFIASRIDGRTSVQEIAQLVGKSKQETERILSRLTKAGLVHFGTEPPRKARVDVEQDDDNPYGNYIFSPALMGEPCDLSEDERKRIIWHHEHLAIWSHYDVLKIRRRDDAKAVKLAYFDRSKEWHPDRFRRGNLGSFRRMIDEIYKRIKTAYDVLSDPDAREKYDDSVVFNPDDSELQEMLDSQRKIERDKRREDEAVERRKRRNPMRKRIENAKTLFEQALDKESQGDLLSALSIAQTAAAFDPRPEYVECVERLKASSGELRVGPYIRRGMHQESLCNWTDAIEIFREAAQLAPENGVVRLRLAYNLVMGGRDAHEANTHAHKAVALLPNDPEAHFVLGLCYEKGGMEKAAGRSFSRVLELKPNHVEAKKHLKKLRWGFLGGS